MSYLQRVKSLNLGSNLSEKTKTTICLITIISLCVISVGALYIINALNPQITLFNDSLRYLDAATNIFEGKPFSFFPNHPKFAYGLPGYPAFIAFTALIHSSMDIGFTIQIQILLHALIIILIFLIAKMYCGRTCAIIAATMAAFLPNLLSNELLLMSESLSVLLLALSLFILFKAFKTQKIIVFALTGIAFGILLYVKQAYQVPVFIIAIIMLFKLKLPFWSRLIASGLMLLLMLLVITPWILRNERIFGRYSLELSTNFGNVLFQSNTPVETFEREYRTLVSPRVQALIDTGDYAQAELLDNELQTDLAMKHIMSDPGVTAVKWFEKVLLIWRPYPGEFFGSLLFSLSFPWSCYYLLLFTGMIVSFIKKPPSPYLILNLVFIITMFLFQSTNMINLRFRLGYELPMLLLSAYGWTIIIRKMFRTRGEGVKAQQSNKSNL